MPRKQSESQDAVARLYEHIASAIENERGLFLGEELNATETRLAVSRARGIAKNLREAASRNRSINN